MLKVLWSMDNLQPLRGGCQIRTDVPFRVWVTKPVQSTTMRNRHIYVKMDKLYLHFTQCFSLDCHQQHRIGCFLTLLSTTFLVVTLPPLTRFIFILICTWIGFSYVTPQTTFLPFYLNR